MEDRLSKDDFVNALTKMYNAGKEGRGKLGALGREHVMKNYNFENFNNDWVKLMDSVYEKYGSWENRKNRENWRSEEL